MPLYFTSDFFVPLLFLGGIFWDAVRALNFSAVFAASLDAALKLLGVRNVDVIIENSPLGRAIYDILGILILKFWQCDSAWVPQHAAMHSRQTHQDGLAL